MVEEEEHGDDQRGDERHGDLARGHVTEVLGGLPRVRHLWIVDLFARHAGGQVPGGAVGSLDRVGDGGDDDDREEGAVVRDERPEPRPSHVPLPGAHQEDGQEDQPGGEEERPDAVHRPVRHRGVVRFVEFILQTLDRGLEEQERDEGPEGLAGEPREGVDVLGRVGECEDEVHERGEDEDPGAEGPEELGSEVALTVRVLEHVVVHQHDGFGDAHDEKGLAAED